jgi:hypothetical protein
MNEGLKSLSRHFAAGPLGNKEMPLSENRRESSDNQR